MANDKSFKGSIPLDVQRQEWERWNTHARENSINQASQRQAQEVECLLDGLHRKDLEIIDVGCGTGWLCGRMQAYGRVTGTDLIDSALDRARERHPLVRFISGSIFDIDLPERHYDVVVTLEVLAHVADQPAFIERLAALLKPGGRLALATQNRPVLERWSAIGGPIPGQLRRWVNARELRALLAPHFHDIAITSLFPVGDQGFLRLFNSHKLNKLLSVVVPEPRIVSMKEKAMLGHTLMAMATRR